MFERNQLVAFDLGDERVDLVPQKIFHILQVGCDTLPQWGRSSHAPWLAPGYKSSNCLAIVLELHERRSFVDRTDLRIAEEFFYRGVFGIAHPAKRLRWPWR